MKVWIITEGGDYDGIFTTRVALNKHIAEKIAKELMDKWEQNIWKENTNTGAMRTWATQAGLFVEMILFEVEE